MLIFDTTEREHWNVQIEPIDSPPVATPAVDVDAAVTRALARPRRSRARAQGDRERADRRQVRRQSAAAGRPAERQLSGERPRRHGGAARRRLPRHDRRPRRGHRLRIGARISCSRSDYPTWAVGVSVSYPIGQSADEANYARARLEAVAGGRAPQERARREPFSRSATPGWKIEMNAKRIETTRAARELAEQRLDAERKRFEVGMSTSFLVIQAQRDLAQAKTNELGAVLAYDLSLVDFEALQEAPPASGDASASGRSSGSGDQPAAVTPAGAGGRSARDSPCRCNSWHTRFAAVAAGRCRRRVPGANRAASDSEPLRRQCPALCGVSSEARCCVCSEPPAAVSAQHLAASVPATIAPSMTATTFRFGPFFADRTTFRVLRGGKAVELTPKLLDLLLHLLDHAGIAGHQRSNCSTRCGPTPTSPRTRWRRRCPSCGRPLKTMPGDPQFIKTVARRGYRFIAPVERRAREGRTDRLDRGIRQIPGSDQRSPSWISPT